MSFFNNVIWPIIASSGIIGLIVYLLKKNLERKIDHRFKQIEVKQKIDLEEITRRQGKLFDEQFTNSKLLCATTYRLKNSSYNIAGMIKSGIDRMHLEKEFENFKRNEHMLTETLYADKLIMEEEVFSVVHDLKHACAAFVQTVSHYLKHNDKVHIDNLYSLATKIENSHYEALSMYKKSLDI